MKLIKNEPILVKQPGTVKIIPYTLDDLFFLHDKLLKPGLIISVATSQKIDAFMLSRCANSRTVRENSSDFFSKKKPIRVYFDVDIKIITVYPVDVSTSVIPIKGCCTSDTKYFKTRDYHSLDLELNKDFCLTNKAWDEKSICMLNQPPVPTKVLSEKEASDIFEKFTNMLLVLKTDKVCYGLKQVERACRTKSIETLMITDDLFRNQDILIRTKYGELADSVKKAKGHVFIFPPKHENLCGMTGVAAILRFPFSYCK